MFNIQDIEDQTHTNQCARPHTARTLIDPYLNKRPS